MLNVCSLSKSYQNNIILKDVSFHLNASDIGIVIGKSGAGKSTLLRCLVGLESFDTGEITINGTSIQSSNDFKCIQSQVGFVFQNFNLFPHLNVLENIILAPVYNLKLKKQEAVDRAMELLTLVDLADKAQAYPCELSGGQQQRVAIARACALSPKLLCLDEPTSALDAESIERVSDILRALSQKGMTLLVITHDLQFASNLSTTLILIENGTVVRN
ncbi:MAG: amino acid ABC transporter ATP-binding protein [Turicibacter sp.]|nr:amino acid ABC transporter ATP-binding protein [Turicibacter sp.]